MLNLDKQWQLGIVVLNPEGATIKYPDFRIILPSTMAIGAKWQPGELFHLMFELDKNLKEELTYRSAIQMQVHKMCYLRGGIYGEPISLSFGTGLFFGSFNIDVGFSHHEVLGLSSAGALTFFWNKKQE